MENIDEKKSIDISQVIKQVYFKIKNFLSKSPNKKVRFSQLVPSENKEDKIHTFIPLLHLATQRKIDLEQHEHFGEIDVLLPNSSQEVDKESGIN